ncbi:MAG: sulfotransferase [Pseudomonadales bacterium]|nr:sulfotransferase [Pseudomonadales bacterium]
MDAKTNKLLPDFLGIGAARSGTTWISKQLESQPGIWIPRIKELHYFSRSPKYLGPSHLDDPHIFRRLFARDEQYTKYRYHLARAIGSNISRPSLEKLKWDYRYFFGKPDDEWYASLFSPAGTKLKGEITPQYAVLDRGDVKAIKEMMPQCKIIFIMREPVDRTWSLLRYHQKRGRKRLTDLPFEALKKEALHPAKIAQSNYAQILTTWREFFDQDQLFLAAYDEITEHPTQLTERLCQFLGLPPVSNNPNQNTTEKKINQSFDKEIPPKLHDILVDFYYNDVKKLSETEGGYFSRWLERYNR